MSLARCPGRYWAWLIDTLVKFHWQTLSQLDATLRPNVKKNLAKVEERITVAEEFYLALANEGIVFSAKSRSEHLEQWSEAIQAFRETASL